MTQSFATTLVGTLFVGFHVMQNACHSVQGHPQLLMLLVGHGGKLRDDDGDEKDGYDETLIPVDYATAGQIRDDDLYKMLVAGLKEDVFATMIMDCCHSGSVLDLPFTFVADGQSEEMTLNQDFDFGPLLMMAAAFFAAQQAGKDPIAAAMTACGGCQMM